MPIIEIKITNLADIQKAFSLAPTLMVRDLNLAIQRSLLEVFMDSKDGTPVDSGLLYNSTYTRFSNLKGEVGTNTEYDVFVHEGTRFMRARPYLRNSIEKNANNIESNFARAVQNTLDKIGAQT